MNAQKTIKAIVVLTAVVAMTGCGSVAAPDAIESSSGSVVLDFPGISSDLRKAVKLNYNLYCAKEKKDIRASKPVTAVDETPDAAKVTLKFAAKEISSGNWCALEAVAVNPADPKLKTYRWLSKKETIGLFYASEASQVTATRRLDATMHVLFEDAAKLDLVIDVEAKIIELETTPGAVKPEPLVLEKAVLVCAIPRNSDSGVKNVFKFNLEKKDFDAGQKCKLKIEWEKESVLSAEFTVKSDVKTYVAEITIDASELRVITKEGTKCVYDTETSECVK